jgi:hypothetical protein
MTATLLPELSHEQRRLAGREIVTFRHRLDDTGLFSDRALARLIDETPIGSMTIQTPGRRGGEPWIPGEAGSLTGAQLVAAARTGTLCLEVPLAHNLRYGRVFDRLMDEFAFGLGLRLLEADARVVISSPHLGPVFHVDTAEAVIFHVRGQDIVQVHEPKGPYFDETRLEAILLEETSADLPADSALRQTATPVTLPPGEAAWWPLHSPHRSLTGNDLSVSMMVRFSSPKTRKANGVLYMNGILRRALGLRIRSSNTPAPLQPAYLAIAQLLRRLLAPPPSRKPEPRFQVDLTAPRCIRWRGRSPMPVRQRVW